MEFTQPRSSGPPSNQFTLPPFPSPSHQPPSVSPGNGKDSLAHLINSSSPASSGYASGGANASIGKTYEGAGGMTSTPNHVTTSSYDSTAGMVATANHVTTSTMNNGSGGLGTANTLNSVSSAGSGGMLIKQVSDDCH